MAHNLDLPNLPKVSKNFAHSIKKLVSSLDELKEIAKIRGTRGYESMSEYILLSALKASKPVKKSEKNFDDTKPKINFSKPIIGSGKKGKKRIRKKFNELRYPKSKINEIRRNLYEIENEKNIFAPNIGKIKKNLLELEENLFKPKRYHNYDDTEYKGIRDVKDLFDLPIVEDYYKAIVINSAFNNNYIQYESKENKQKNLSIKEYINVIRPYLSDIINNCKAQEKLRIQSGNTIIEHKTQGQ